MEQLKIDINKDLLNELELLYTGKHSVDEYYEPEIKQETDENSETLTENESETHKRELSAKGQEYLAFIKQEILKRMNSYTESESFSLYGVKDISTGKLVSDITNPRHKFWEKEASAYTAIKRYNPLHIRGGVREKHKQEDLKLVKIQCRVSD